MRSITTQKAQRTASPANIKEVRTAAWLGAPDQAAVALLSMKAPAGATGSQTPVRNAASSPPDLHRESLRVEHLRHETEVGCSHEGSGSCPGSPRAPDPCGLPAARSSRPCRKLPDDAARVVGVHAEPHLERDPVVDPLSPDRNITSGCPARTASAVSGPQFPTLPLRCFRRRHGRSCGPTWHCRRYCRIRLVLGCRAPDRRDVVAGAKMRRACVHRLSRSDTR